MRIRFVHDCSFIDRSLRSLAFATVTWPTMHRLRAAGFEKNQMAARYLRFGRERELAHAPQRAPLAQ